MAEDHDLISLNVGGTIFTTSKTNLLSKGSSLPSAFFTAVFSGAPTDTYGAMIIDRSPEKFRVILEYLRTGHLEVPESMSRQTLITEGEYYCLDNFVEAVRRSPNLKDDLGYIDNGDIPRSLVRMDGIYVSSTNEICFAFRPNKRCLSAVRPRKDQLRSVSKEPSADASAKMTAYLAATADPEWRAGPFKDPIERLFNLWISFGTYDHKVENNTVTLTFSGPLQGVVSPNKLLLFNAGSMGIDSYDFVPWSEC